MAGGLWWTAKQRCKRNRRAQLSAVESVLTSHSLWAVVETAAVSFIRNRGGENTVAEEIRLCKELILFWAEELRLQRENSQVRGNIRSLRGTVRTLNRRRDKMKMEIDKLTDEVEDYVERAQDLNRVGSARSTPVDHFNPHYEENDLALMSAEVEKVQQEGNCTISMSQVWSQILLEGEPHAHIENQQLVRQELVNKPSNTNAEAPKEQMDGSIKDEQETQKDKLPPKSPVRCLSPKIKGGSVSETSIPQETAFPEMTPQQVKSEILDDKSPAEEFSIHKPDVTVQDREISGMLDNRYDMTTEIMAIIENEVLYHIFPVQIIVDPANELPGGSSQKIELSSENVGNDETKENKTVSQVKGGCNESAASLSSSASVSNKEAQSTQDAQLQDDETQNTVETYMHHMYGNEITPRRELSEISCSFSQKSFVVNGEELLPRFEIEGQQSQSLDQDVAKKVSENSFSSETTDMSSDFDDESKEILILDLAIARSGSSTTALTERDPNRLMEKDDNKDELCKSASRSSTNDATSLTNLSKTPRSRKSKKPKSVRSTNQKVKKFFCFT